MMILSDGGQGHWPRPQKARQQEFALPPMKPAFLLTLRWALGFSLEFHSTGAAPATMRSTVEVMKVWIVAAVLFIVSAIAVLASAPLFTGTWIVKNGKVGTVEALVFTVGIGETGPVVRIRKVSAAREGEELYAAIHEAARVVLPSNSSSMNSSFVEKRHWGGGQSWCNGENCQRFYVFFGSYLDSAGGRSHSAICRNGVVR